MGFQSCSKNTTVSALVRFRPSPPTCVVSSSTWAGAKGERQLDGQRFRHATKGWGGGAGERILSEWSLHWLSWVAGGRNSG